MPGKRNIVITGGSSGLGLELAAHYARQGEHIGLVARNPEKLHAAAERLLTLNPDARVEWRSADVVDPLAARTALDELAGSLGGMDILINSAGILREGRFDELPLEAFREVMDINLFGIINSSRAALPHLEASRGKLVNIASMAALTGVYGYSAYTASKHALAGLTESMRYELKPRGVTVQLICPPEFESPMVDELNTYRSAENRAHSQIIPVEPVETIVRDTVEAIECGRYFTVTGSRARLVAIGLRHFPRLSRLLADRVISKTGESASEVR